MGRMFLDRLLATNEFHVVVGARNPSTQTLQHENVEFLPLDLSDYDSVNAFCKKYIEKQVGLHLLILNAGVAQPGDIQLTKNQVELHAQTNLLSHFLLTHQLLPVMKNTAKEAKEGPLRIVHTSSMLYAQAERFTMEEFLTGKGLKSSTFSVPAYTRSKLAVNLFSNKLARDLEGFNRDHDVHITSNCFHPGFIDSDLFRNISVLLKPVWALMKVIFKYRGTMILPEEAAKNLEAMCLDASLDASNGAYFGFPRGQCGHMVEETQTALAKDEAYQDEFWSLCEKHLKI